MKIHEYQAKALLAQFNVPIPKGGVAKTAARAKKLAEQLGGKAVVKAQVHAGGRGKAGGVKLVNSPEEAQAIAKALLGKRLVTHQTGPEGVPVHQVLVEEQMAVHKELYLSIIVDSGTRMPVMMASEAGGMEIEEVAARTPEKIFKAVIHPAVGFQPYQARQLAYGMNIKPELVRAAVDVMTNLYKVFEAKDCTLAEINPLVITADGRVLALDAKLNFDDDALFRHTDVAEMRDPSQEEPLEVEAHKADISYIKLDGDVGCMVNGAGLAMATMDVIKLMGAEPANFLDVGGGASEEQVQAAFKILLADSKVKRVLVNVFGGILRCDVAAKGIIGAVKEVGVNVPIVVRMRGTNMDEGKQILAQSSLNVIVANDLKEAAQKVVAVGVPAAAR
ncbi:MAG: ADP-forming succinate--CoA ligase subunit beta [Chloroflexi bacterium]|nr:ADP-forming succinate--CoA ligase subunit beta [Chloroflexota bacterium]